MEEQKQMQYKVGILGSGQLGQVMALALLKRGFPKKDLLLSYRGNPETYRRLETRGLAECLADNNRVLEESDIILITVKPQDILELKHNSIPAAAVMVSCLAGVSTALLEQLLHTTVIRTMPCSPDAILAGEGIVGIVGNNSALDWLFGRMSLQIVRVESEEELDVFTAGVCLSAALLKGEDPKAMKEAVIRIGRDYPLLNEVYAWAVKTLPVGLSDEQKTEYITQMATKGGITHAIIHSMEEGLPLDQALRRGIARTKEIAREIDARLRQG